MCIFPFFRFRKVLLTNKPHNNSSSSILTFSVFSFFIPIEVCLESANHTDPFVRGAVAVDLHDITDVVYGAIASDGGVFDYGW